MDSSGEEFEASDLLWLLGSISSLYRIPFDPGLIAQEFPPPYRRATFHQAARALGLKTGSVALANINWQKLPLPAIAFLTAVPAVATTPGTNEIDVSTQAPVLILKGDGHKLLYFRSGAVTVNLWTTTQDLLEESYQALKGSVYQSLVLQTAMDAANDSEWRRVG